MGGLVPDGVVPDGSVPDGSVPDGVEFGSAYTHVCTCLNFKLCATMTCHWGHIGLPCPNVYLTR